RVDAVAVFVDKHLGHRHSGHLAVGRSCSVVGGRIPAPEAPAASLPRAVSGVWGHGGKSACAHVEIMSTEWVILMAGCRNVLRCTKAEGRAVGGVAPGLA